MQDIPYDVSHVPIDYDEYANVKEVNNKISRKDERRERIDERAALERDVSQLQKQLIIEMNMRNALSRGLSRPLGSLPKIYASLPVETRDLLLEVAVLEEEIVSLEKQVVHLGREIDIEVMPTIDKETIWQNSYQDTSLEKLETLDYLSVPPKDSARINSKPSLSPRKSIDQKSNLSKPSLLAGKVAENRSSSIKTVSNSRKPVDSCSSLKSSTSPKDSSEPTTVVPPQKSLFQRSSSLPKASLRNTKDLKSRRPSFAKNEPQETTFSPTHTIPFIPLKISSPKEDEESTGSPLSSAPLSPSDCGSSCSQPPRIKTENGKPPMTRNTRLGRKDPLSNKDAPTARSVKAPSTSRPGQGKVLQLSSGLPRLPPTQDNISTRRTMKSTTAAFEQRMNTQRSSSTPNPRATFNCDSNLQVPVDAEAGIEDANNELDTPATGEVDGDNKATCLSPDIMKINQPNCSPKLYSKLDMEKEADSMFLPEEVVKLLKTIYGNMQERQTPLASDFGSSSQASITPSHFSTSPDDYEMKGTADINVRLNDCYTGSFITKRSISMKYMRDCGEVAESTDPYTYLNRGNFSNRTDFHQRLMS